jgi:hypothetical protein
LKRDRHALRRATALAGGRLDPTRRRRSRARASGAGVATPRVTTAAPIKARVGAALLALLCAWIALGQAWLLRAALGTRGESASPDLVSVALLGFFGIPAWIGLIALLRHARAAFAPWMRGVLYLPAALPPLLGVLGFVLARIV